MGAPDPKAKRPRTKRILKRFPFWARPFLRWFLGRCAECPSRIICIESALGGKRSLLNALSSFDCYHQLRPGMIAKEISRFAKLQCLPCRSRGACCQYLGNHVLRISPSEKDRWPEARARIEDIIARCGSCADLSSCMQGAIVSCGGIPLIIIRHLAIRIKCRLGMLKDYEASRK